MYELTAQALLEGRLTPAFSSWEKERTRLGGAVSIHVGGWCEGGYYRHVYSAPDVARGLIPFS